MAWICVNQHALSWFASLGTTVGDSYIASPDCIEILAEINNKLSTEDRTLRTFRRTIGFSGALQKDFIPLLISVKDPDIISSTIRILVNLSVPVECLLPVEVMSRSDAGRMTIFELNSFLVNSKEVFVNPKITRAIIEYVKKTIEMEEKEKLTEGDCDSINNCLLLLRNVLHIPENRVGGQMHHNAHGTTVQNQIVWNLFIQNIDKVLIHLMTSENRSYWGVSMVQLIAIMYKDQHVGTLQKLLNLWCEASVSDSSEDNESNTSPPDQGSDSSNMLTSDPTSDSSDNGGGSNNKTGSQHHEGSSGVPHVVQRNPLLASSADNSDTKMLAFEDSVIDRNERNERKSSSSGGNRKSHGNKNCNSKRGSDGDSAALSMSSDTSGSAKGTTRISKGENQRPKWESFSPEASDCGYSTQVENPEMMSTSSNEEETPQAKRPVHQKHHSQKIRYCSNKQVPAQDKKELRRKKLVKRSRTAMINMKAMVHHTPTDEDITHILKEFTVDFLLKAYGPLVKVIHSLLLSPSNPIRVDTSHFFWLVTYFLKFASQLELDLELVRDVLSYDILSYLTFEAVSICETVEVAAKRSTTDMKPNLRRQHLVVTAIREFLQTVDNYFKMPHLSVEDKAFLASLQLQIIRADDLKCLFVLLLRQYNPAVHNKQYLQDVVVTNHVLLTFLEKSASMDRTSMGPPDNMYGLSMIDHMKQFASVDVIRQYGTLLEDFQINGEFVNDCVFTMLHHIGGDINHVSSLFQPNILKTFTQIWEKDFELCDDWSDLIEYVIHKFTSQPHQCLVVGSQQVPGTVPPANGDFGWSKEECDNLTWYFAQSSNNSDPISGIVKLYEEDGVFKSRNAIIRRLMQQGVVNADQYEHLLSVETMSPRVVLMDEDTAHVIPQMSIGDEIDHLRDELVKDDHEAQLCWLQRLLLETCYAKLPRNLHTDVVSRPFEAIAFHYSHLNQSVPLVVWNSEQTSVLQHQPFQLLLHKLGFHLPEDTGKGFPRIPSFWTVDVLYSVAQKLGPIDADTLKFRIEDIVGKVTDSIKRQDISQTKEKSEQHHFTVPRSKHTQFIVKYTPVPNMGSSWLDIVKSSKGIASAGNIDEDMELSKPCKETDLEGSDKGSVCSVCETTRDSVASDLTRMCVSDEDEVPAKD